MNRHLSKAKRTDTGDWVVGYYRCQPNFKRERHLIQTYKENLVVEIDSNTLCRNTGHPNNIYEGDEIEAMSHMSDNKYIGYVQWSEKTFGYVVKNKEDTTTFSNLYVMGWSPTGKNIHD